jgi:hypothetical protein
MIRHVVLASLLISINDVMLLIYSYDSKFWDSLDGICTALDNVQARIYVDGRCVFFQVQIYIDPLYIRS